MNMVKQLTVSMQNQPGKLAEVEGLLTDNGVSVLALSADTSDNKGTLRFVANDPDKASNVLKSFGYDVAEQAVIAAEVPSHPGGMLAILKPLHQAQINVGFIYNTMFIGDKVIVIVGIDKIEEGIDVLRKNWINLFDEKLYEM
ncbi:MAG: amino acid-binding protein [Deltaproteobacteria bacterium]|nr:amino acid-binding protein [Deltaproteobacteria bacterium]